MKKLLTLRALVTVWIPLFCIGCLHYVTPPEAHWVHDVARRLFYVPILLGGLQGGMRSGLVVAGVVVLVYSPHAFIDHIGHDPASHIEKLFEMFFYGVIGGVSGFVVEREQRRLRQLAAKDDQLERAARLESMGQLSAGLAHEIKNPLHAMRGTAEIMLDALPEEAPEHGLGVALISEIDRLTGVLKRFLEFARKEESVGEWTPVDLDTVVRRVAELVRAQAGRQDTRLELQTEGGRVHGDPDQLTQVVLALALNGLQALGEGGCLSLSAKGPRIRVENDGPPIPMDHLGRLFDPFFTTRPEGTGLGLSVAWRIVDSHGGRLTAENTESGVAFEVDLADAPGATC